MPITIDIDTGGTFTDGVFSRDGLAHGVKVLTTPHDLTVGMLECVQAGADELGLTIEALLADTAVARFSSTIVTNAVIERRGYAVGVLVDAGAESTLYGASLIEARLVRPELVAGIETPFATEAVQATVERLLDSGARTLVVSLAGSFQDCTPERRVREIVHQLYPPQFLGSVKVFLASDLSQLPGPSERTSTAVLNAFVHERLARSVYRVEEELRRQGLRKPLLIVHGHGGLARAAKTLAIHTWNSGPVAGVAGATAIRTAHTPEKAVVTLDIGGTSSDFSLIADDRHRVAWIADVDGIPAHVPSVEITALPIGGGSVAWTDNGDLRIGPESAGAFPGPACFDRGGVTPTLTDANVCLGYLDPVRFHGGRLPLNSSRAEEAIMKVAGDLGIESADAARRIRSAADSVVANGIDRLLSNQGVPPSDVALVAYGGGGPLHAAAVAAQLGIDQVVVPQTASIFSAMGVSSLDVAHTYPLLMAGDLALEAMRERLIEAHRDMASEGFAGASVRLSVDIIDLNRSGTVKFHYDFRSDLENLISDGVELASVVGEVNRSSYDQRLLLLRAAAASPHLTAETVTPGHESLVPRWIDWGDGQRESVVIAGSALSTVHATPGPAIVAAFGTTIAVPPGWEAHRERSAVILEKS